MNDLVPAILVVIAIVGICAFGVFLVERSNKKKKEQLTDYISGDKLTVRIRQGEHTSLYCKATIIRQDYENTEYFYCEVIYPTTFEEPLERIHYTQIEKNLSLERRNNSL